MNLLETLKPVQCSCKICKAMCVRPCFGTPKDIQKLIDEGYADRLTLDTHCGVDPGAVIFILTPALKGFEGKASPYLPYSRLGCTFWSYGKCKLHSSGLKPIGGKLACHDNSNDPENTLSGLVSETWNSEEGRELVKKWCDERGIEIKEPIPSKSDTIELLMKNFILY